MARPVALLLLLLAVGCKSSGGGSSPDRGGPLGLGVFDRRDGSSSAEGRLATRGDPLLGGKYIPKQTLPTADKDGLASRDPLLVPPGGRGDAPPTDKGDKVGRKGRTPPNAPSDDAKRPTPDEPYRPGPATTTAALAGGRLDPTDPRIAIDPDRRPAGTPTGRGPVPLTPGGTGGRTFDEIAAELTRTYEAAVGDPAKEGGQWVVRAEVPIDPSQPGRLRAYDGVGPTPAAAAKNLLDQVRDDRKR
jgi:hypothetical protein